MEIRKRVAQADELGDTWFVVVLRDEERVIWRARLDAALPVPGKSRDVVAHSAESTLMRMSQLKVGQLLAIMNNHVDLDESIVCLSGVAGSERLDTLLIATALRDFPLFREHNIDEIRDTFATPARRSAARRALPETFRRFFS